MAALELDVAQVHDFCRRHHICKLALFGSVLRSDFTPESDVDVLVEFEAGHLPGLAFFAMQALRWVSRGLPVIGLSSMTGTCDNGAQKPDWGG